ncbi:MAG: type II toxin-antitoxin system VapC family toxin [Terracidiphilus sp.]|jgi:predicted nucleic acid-binding protein
MPFVLDASVSASWALADEYSPLAESAQNQLREDFAVVPRIWWYEIRNLLVVNERRLRITADHSATFLRLLSSYPIRFEPTEDEQDVLRIARQYRLSFYDAAYLSVAAGSLLPLATLDRNLQSAAESAGIPLFA